MSTPKQKNVVEVELDISDKASGFMQGFVTGAGFVLLLWWIT